MLFKKAKLTFPAILFLVLLRLVIGWHFFQEGAVKVKEGFSSTPFLSAAKGPFAKQFQSMIPTMTARFESMRNRCRMLAKPMESRSNESSL